MRILLFGLISVACYLQDDRETDRLNGKYAAIHSHPTRFGSGWDSSSKGWKSERLAWLGHDIPKDTNADDFLAGLAASNPHLQLPPWCEAPSESDLDDVSVLMEDGFCLAKPVALPPYQSFLWRLWRDEEEDFPSAKKLAAFDLTDLLQYDEIDSED